jgi:putative endopeptidase
MTRIFALLAGTMLAGSAAAQTPAATATVALTTKADSPQYGTFGFDEAGMDRSIRPGVDFYGYANGTWTKTTPIPADRSNYGMFTVLDDLSTERSRGILEEAAKRPGSQIGDFYASFMDEKAADAAGIKPLTP